MCTTQQGNENYLYINRNLQNIFIIDIIQKKTFEQSFERKNE